MMNVSRQVVLDLLPVYLSGEASPETCAFVEQYLTENPGLAEEVERLRKEDPFTRASTLGPPPELALRSLRRTRSILAWQRWLFALALFFTLVGASFEFSGEDGHITEWHLLLRDSPAIFGTSLALGIACWIGYVLLRRR